ncbi:MAG: Spo0B domain-containing protein [Oscillospiraceae bacterium]|jgi:sensor histidine kinase regulating citrate/malate metabolism|nr:Spo0B domain-containing protein [Oscillospiraceae bacterium]
MKEKRIRLPIDGQTSVGKLLVFTAIVHALQIAAVAALVAFALYLKPWNSDMPRLSISVIAAGVAALAGVFMGMQQTRATRDMLRQTNALTQTARALETLNIKLRSQRHDFMNHLQVIGSLLEMNEYAEAEAYIEKVYGDVQSVGMNLRTAVPAVNALLMVKQAECEKRGILFEAQITSDWRGLPLPGWEMCRVLGNLIDNARDALAASETPRLTIQLFEEIDRYRFRVINNGPIIPKGMRQKVFESGFTTKFDGQGLGLSIVRQIVTKTGGDVALESDALQTAFSGWIPRGSRTASAEEI